MAVRRVRTMVGILVAGAAASAVYGTGVGPASAASVEYTAPGAYEVTAPVGTTCATLVVDGAHGGAGNALGGAYNTGGAGGEVTVTVATTGGTTFTLRVGGRGGDASLTAPGAGGADGGGDGGSGVDESVGQVSGGGGGGSSSVERSGATVAVAGGGGGGSPDAPGYSVGGQGGGGGAFVVADGMGRDGARGGDALLGAAKGGEGGTGTAGGAGGAAGGAERDRGH